MTSDGHVLLVYLTLGCKANSMAFHKIIQLRFFLSSSGHGRARSSGTLHHALQLVLEVTENVDSLVYSDFVSNNPFIRYSFSYLSQFSLASTPFVTSKCNLVPTVVVEIRGAR